MLEGVAVESINKLEVLLDGGASHHVFWSPQVPEGAVEKEAELTHGSKMGYVKDDDVTFVDDAAIADKADIPTIISPGRVIEKRRFPYVTTWYKLRVPVKIVWPDAN